MNPRLVVGVRHLEDQNQLFSCLFDANLKPNQAGSATRIVDRIIMEVPQSPATVKIVHSSFKRSQQTANMVALELRSRRQTGGRTQRVRSRSAEISIRLQRWRSPRFALSSMGRLLYPDLQAQQPRSPLRVRHYGSSFRQPRRKSARRAASPV